MVGGHSLIGQVGLSLQAPSVSSQTVRVHLSYTNICEEAHMIYTFLT